MMLVIAVVRLTRSVGFTVSSKWKRTFPPAAGTSVQPLASYLAWMTHGSSARAVAATRLLRRFAQALPTVSGGRKYGTMNRRSAGLARDHSDRNACAPLS